MANPDQNSGPAQPVQWDRSKLVSSDCNVASAFATREGVVLNFGIARERERSTHEIGVELLHRVTLDRTAASRLQQLLIKLAADYEARYQQSK